MTTTTLSEQAADRAVARAQVQFVIATVAVVGVLLSIGATAGWGLRVGVGVLAGAALATANMWSLKRIGAGFLAGDGRGRRVWGFVGAVKFLVLAGVLVALVALHLVHPLSLLVGYGALPVGITVGSLLGPRAPEGSVH
jgi:hypothetical protein